jgi:chemotaxis protein CheX
MIPDEQLIRTVVRSVWSTQLGLAISDLPNPPDVRSTGATHTAVIHISGDFRGVVRLQASLAMVRRAAAVMFDTPEDRLDRDDERDVIGELANVVAGNLKALLAGSSNLSLPTIVEGSDYRISTLAIASSRQCSFSLDGEWLTVTMVEHRDA